MHSFIVSLLPVLILSGGAHNQPTAKPEAAKPTVAENRPDESASESGPHFKRARELYALGPTKAEEIIAELDLELREHPENVEAFLLKAMTQMGVAQFDAALTTLDQLSEVASKTETIYPSAVLLRARVHFYKGDYKTAKQTLEPYWAFFQDDADNKSLYDSLMAAIAAKMQEPKKE